jgi:peroxiredoxin (alkyl hydroperoxide reductase subunit C)
MADDVCCGVRVGQKVPDFEMTTYEPATGKYGKFSLAENKAKGKWTILFFYPADFTFVCPTELKDVGDIYAEIQKLGGELVSVSTDTWFVHLAWQRDEKLLKDIKYPMGADQTLTVSKLFGVLEESNGLAYRGTFIIDPSGTLQASEVNQLNVGRSSDELLRKFKAFVYVSQHDGEVCPAKWQQGAKTLKPGSGEAMTGKVYEALQ